jgi:hypothetical protein
MRWPCACATGSLPASSSSSKFKVQVKGACDSSSRRWQEGRGQVDTHSGCRRAVQGQMQVQAPQMEQHLPQPQQARQWNSRVCRV